MIDLEWMRWTEPTFTLFVCVILMLTGMTIWDIRSPAVKRKGFLPFGFTRGERLFLSIVIFLSTVILWMAFAPDEEWYISFPIAAVIIFIVVKWG